MNDDKKVYTVYGISEGAQIMMHIPNGEYIIVATRRGYVSIKDISTGARFEAVSRKWLYSLEKKVKI